MISTMVKTLCIGMLCIFFGCKESNEKKGKEAAALESDMTEIVSTKADTELDIYDFDGLEPMLHKEGDKVYVVNFWATWCGPCVEELPYYEKINAEENNVEVILVSLDMPKMWESHLIPFINNKELKSKVVVLDDPKQNTWIPKVEADWSGAIPATLIYNKSKRSFYEQSFTYKELVEQLNTFKQ